MGSPVIPTRLLPVCPQENSDMPSEKAEKKPAKKKAAKAKKSTKKRSIVIVESPAKAKTINRYLGDDFVVKASMGHVRDLPASKLGVDVDKGFEPEYVTIRGRGKALDELRKLAKNADKIYMATDLDREGEAIAWHLCRALEIEDDEALRVTFNEITEVAIKEAFEKAGRIDSYKVDAQQARRILDRLVGYKLSPLLWKKVTRGLSAGRVQSVTVRLLVEREREIRAFVEEEYWRFAVRVSPESQEELAFEAELKKLDDKKVVVADEERATVIANALRRGAYRISSVVRKHKTARPYPPFITSTLQQQASIRLRYTAKKTMMLAQQLYEGVELGDEGAVGLITYMRTDSVNLADSAVAECREYIAENYPADYLPEKPVKYRSRKDAQGAHEAVRPTAANHTPEAIQPHLSRDQFRLYELIWKRFIACQMAPARLEMTEIDIEANVPDAKDGEPSRARFRATGRRTVFDGYTRLLSEQRKDDQELPALDEDQPMDLIELMPTQHFTQPPPRYTEATLVKTMEREGIGRPSTYAPIISTIQDRGYVKREKARFYATELGEVVTDLLVPHFHDIMDVGFTSQMESRLDTIEADHADWREILGEFYETFEKDLEKAEVEMKDLKKEPEVSEEVCPKCGLPMVFKWFKNRKFLGCSGYPECKSTKSLSESGEVREPEATDHVCEKCGEPMVIREGKRGRFLSCSAFPKCRNSMSIDDEGNPVVPEVTDIKCRLCEKPMVMKSGRRGPFLACSGYPECKSTMPVDKEGNPIVLPDVTEECEKCGAIMVPKLGRRGPFLACTGFPKCRNTKPMPGDEKKEADEKKDAAEKKDATEKKDDDGES
jgi:DNA topoisomerase I